MKQIKTFLFWLIGIQAAQMTLLLLWLFRGKSAIYGTNDDSLIASIASGQLTGQSDPHLIFIQPLISYPITWLEYMLPQFSGYSIFLIFCTTLSFSAVLSLLISTKQLNFINITFWTFFNLIFQSWFAINPTYTGASLFAAGAGAAFFNYALIQRISTSNLFRNFILTNSALFSILCYGIRKEGIYVFGVLVIPMILIYLKLIIKDYQIVKFYLIPVIIFYFFNYLLYSNLYNSDKWNEYMSLNESRHKIQLRAPEKFIADKLPDIEWNKEIYFMFVRFSLIDNRQMNKEKLQKILELNQEYVGPKTILQTNFSEIKPIIKEAFNPWTWILKIQIIMILIIGLSKLKEKIFKDYSKYLALQVLMVMIFIIVLSIRYQIPERISLNLLAALTLSLFAHTSINQKPRIRSSLTVSISSVFLLMLFIYLALTRISIETKAREGLYLTRQAYANQQIESLSKLDEQVVISNGSGLKTHWKFPYIKWKTFDPRDKTIILGWHNLSPLSSEQFKIRNLNLSNYPKDIINNEVYWVDSREEIDISRDYFQQFTDKDLDYSEKGKIGNDEYQFYRFLTIE
jgi:hypothetical protein